MSAKSSKQEQKQVTIWDTLPQFVEQVNRLAGKRASSANFRRHYKEILPTFYGTADSPCITCQTACWQVAEKMIDIQSDTIESCKIHFKQRSEYSLVCFCLVKHEELTNYPIMCAGNPEYVPTLPPDPTGQEDDD